METGPLRQAGGADEVRRPSGLRGHMLGILEAVYFLSF